MLYLGDHLQGILYSSLACAVSCEVLKCIGLHSCSLGLGWSIFVCCLIILHLWLEPFPQGCWWAVCASAVLLFILGTQQLLSALAREELPRGFFAYVGRSHVLWLSPLVAAVGLAAALLLWRFLELLMAAYKGGYSLFCPPNPHVHDLDTLAAAAAEGKPLSLSPREPIDPPSAFVLSQLFAGELSPRRLGATIAQQRRTVAGPRAAAAVVADTPPVAAERGGNAVYRKRSCSMGAWLVSLWLRGPFMLAAFGCVCVFLALLLLALAADSAADAKGAQGPAVFKALAILMLPQQEEGSSSFIVIDEHHQEQLSQQERPRGTLPPSRLQQRETSSLRKKDRGSGHQQKLHPYTILQMKVTAELNSPTAGRHAGATASAVRNTVSGQRSEMPEAETTLLQLPGLSATEPAKDGEMMQQRHQLQQQKTAAALLLFAVVLLMPLMGGSLGKWVEGEPEQPPSVFCVLQPAIVDSW